jgi:hypothetical protein
LQLDIPPSIICSMKKASKPAAKKSVAAKLPPILRAPVEPTHATRAEIRRVVREVMAEREKARA